MNMTFNLSSFCCICLFETAREELYSLYNTDTDHVKIIDKLKFCQFGNEWLDNNVPVFICSICRRNLQISYEFKKICLENNERIKSYILHIKGIEMRQQNPILEINRFTNYQYEKNKTHPLYPVCQINVNYDQHNLQNMNHYPQPHNKNEYITLPIGSTAPIDSTNIKFQPELIKIEPPDSPDENHQSSKDQTISYQPELVKIEPPDLTDNFDNVNDGSKDHPDPLVKIEVSNLTPSSDEDDGSKDQNSLKDLESSKDHEISKVHDSSDENYVEESSTDDEEIVTNTGKKKFQKRYQKLCTICNKIFAGSTELKRHTMQHTGERPHRCSMCDKSFIQLTSLKDHILTHSNERNYTCHFCNKSFTLKKTLRKHYLTHSGEKKYLCMICSKSFAQKYNFDRHLAVHQGVKPHQCTYCEKHFSDKSNLDKHILTHTGQRPHICKECNKSFIRKSELNKHCLIHTSERSYACTICCKHFADKTVFDNHLMTHTVHTGEKPHMCSFCNKCFVNKYTFNRHLTLCRSGAPSGGPPMDRQQRCTYCGKSFSSVSGLSYHVATHHSFW